MYVRLYTTYCLCVHSLLTRRMHHDPKPVGLPDDFDINSPIAIVSDTLKRVPLSMYFHNYIKRLEEERANLSGCTWFSCCISCVFIKFTIKKTCTGKVRTGILNLLKKFKIKVLRNQSLKSHTHDPEPVGLPDDFDINASIPTVTDVLKRVRLSMDCHNYIERLEEKRAKLAGCTWFPYCIIYCVFNKQGHH